VGLNLIPEDLRARYTFDEREHACAILKEDFPTQWDDILTCLRAFTLKKSYIVAKGGAKSPVSEVIDGFLQGVAPVQKKLTKAAAAGVHVKRPPTPPIGPVSGRGWKEKMFDIEISVDRNPVPIPTHKIDNFKQLPTDKRGVGVEVEWNNKDPFFDRDLNNFRLLRNLGVLSVGVIITRLTELQAVFDQLQKGKSYGNSTTHWDKLMPRVNGGGAGGCPLLLVGMGLNCYDANS
jgi:hypothetical protein